MSATVLYFGYGANMNPAVLRRRRMEPEWSCPAVLEDWVLCFSAPGLPMLEPAFADVRPCPGREVHGVLHALTAACYERMLRDEGGGGHDDAAGYAVQHLEVATEDGTRVARVLVHDSSVIAASDIPSLRYARLLEEGARHFQLDHRYVDFLAHQPRFAPSPLGRLGAGALLVAATPALLPAWVTAKLGHDRWLHLATMAGVRASNRLVGDRSHAPFGRTIRPGALSEAERLRRWPLYLPPAPSQT